MRNRFQRIEKGKKLREEGQELKNKCHACGQPKRGHICRAKQRGSNEVDLPTPPSGVVGRSGGLNLGSVPVLSHGSTNSHPPLKRTRSGSKLVPVHGAAPSLGGGNVIHDFNVDLAAAAGGLPQHPAVKRTNTSFFRELVASELFSPGSREMFEAWASSPRDLPPEVAAAVAGDNAPPSLRRVASRDVTNTEDPTAAAAPPPLTRSLTSLLKDISGDTGGAPSTSMPPPTFSGGGRAPGSLSRQNSIGLSLLGGPGLSRQASLNPQDMLGGRSVTSFMRDFIDESATLESAPPASAVPPSLRLSTSQSSFDALGDFGLGRTDSLGLGGGGLGSLGGPPSLSRRASPRVAGIASPNSFLA